MMIQTSTHENIYMDKISIGYFKLPIIYLSGYLLQSDLSICIYNAEQHLMLLNCKQNETRELLSDAIILNKQKFMHLIQ